MTTTVAANPAAPSMRFTVDGWDPAYGNAFDIEDTVALPETEQRIDATVETAEADWAAVPVRPVVAEPSAVLFVDGVRRIDARLWIEPLAASETPQVSICASISAGVVCCCPGRAHLTAAQTRRLLMTTSSHATNVLTGAATWQVAHVAPHAVTPLLPLLSQGLQQRLAQLEIGTALQARSASDDHSTGDADLLVIDGPLKGRAHLPRALGYIKTHRAEYLPAHLNAVVGRLGAGERTPVFLLGTGWDRHTWYLRLPTTSRAPWAGVVRVECSADLATNHVLALAHVSQHVLPRHASLEFRDPRAPQNLNPIGGLEQQLRHRLGDSRVLYRALQAAST
jgi:hypothetical protein